MKVFLPFKKEANPYLDEIIRCSSHEFTYGDYNANTSDYSIVNIHWPEAIFNWHEPDQEQLEILESVIKNWKKSSILVYTKHDYRRNKGTTPMFDRLFRLVEKYADVFLHLGEYSLDQYKKKYPGARHELLYHPLYSHTFKDYQIGKRQARKKLNIHQDAFVVSVPGNIRSFEERKLVMRAFNSIKIPKKVLIVANMRSEIRFDFKGRVKLKKIFDIRNYVVERFKQKHSPPKYLFNYTHLSPDELAPRVEAADVVLIPRKDILNSGIPYLALTFGKIAVGPRIGNIQELLENLNFPVFDPKSKKSVISAMEEAIQLTQKDYFPADADLLKYRPENVAAVLDSIFVDLER